MGRREARRIRELEDERRSLRSSVEDLSRERARLRGAFMELEEKGERLEQELSLVRRENQLLRDKVQALIDRVYGRSSERVVDPNQKLFFPELFAAAAEKGGAEGGEEPEEEKAPRRKRKRGGRRPLPENLERRRVVLPPVPEDGKCPGCESGLVKIGEEVTEELDYQPGRFFVNETVREKLACKSCEEGVYIPPLPPRPIEKGRPGPGLLAHLVVSKYGDHLPLYRLEQIFARSGVELSRTTLSSWVGAISELLEPLVKEMKRQLFESPLIQSDDTGMRVQDPAIPGKCRKGFCWAYTVPWGEVLYDFTLSRSRDGPLEFLKGYRGFLQADFYSGNNEVLRVEKIVLIGCWAHVRRKFHEARFQSPHRVREIIARIRELYAIERAAKDAGLAPGARAELRGERARPLLVTLKEKIQQLDRTALPESPLRAATQYALRGWAALERYVEVGEAEIDNNSCEAAVRPLAIGRKNWLFVGAPQAGRRIEVLASLVTSCKRLGIDPYAYLRDVIERISTHPQSRIAELTPRGWRGARTALR